MKSAARSIVASLVGASFVAGCGGVSEPSQAAVGQVDHALASPYPGQVSFPGAAAGSTVVSVGAGNVHAFARTSDGKRWGWGFNNYGQVGIAATTVINTTPTELRTSLSGVLDLQGGKSYYSATVSSSGYVFTFGNNSSGQLGDGTTTTTSTPVLALTNAVAVDAGTEHTVALRSDGTVWAWGKNIAGQLGDGTFTGPRLSAVQVTGLSGVTITAIAAGGDRTYALDSTGGVWTWGIQTAADGAPVSTPQQVTGISSATAIAANEFSAIILKSDGTVWNLGYKGALSQVTGFDPPTEISTIAAGGTHFLAVDKNGALWSWGGNSSGQLGDGTTTTRTTPVRVLRSATPGDYFTGVVAVAGGVENSYAILADGTLWSWGSDSFGALGR